MRIIGFLLLLTGFSYAQDMECPKLDTWVDPISFCTMHESGKDIEFLYLGPNGDEYETSKLGEDIARTLCKEVVYELNSIYKTGKSCVGLDSSMPIPHLGYLNLDFDPSHCLSYNQYANFKKTLKDALEQKHYQKLESYKYTPKEVTTIMRHFSGKCNKRDNIDTLTDKFDCITFQAKFYFDKWGEIAAGPRLCDKMSSIQDEEMQLISYLAPSHCKQFLNSKISKKLCEQKNVNKCLVESLNKASDNYPRRQKYGLNTTPIYLSMVTLYSQAVKLDILSRSCHAQLDFRSPFNENCQIKLGRSEVCMDNMYYKIKYAENIFDAFNDPDFRVLEAITPDKECGDDRGQSNAKPLGKDDRERLQVLGATLGADALTRIPTPKSDGKLDKKKAKVYFTKEAIRKTLKSLLKSLSENKELTEPERAHIAELAKDAVNPNTSRSFLDPIIDDQYNLYLNRKISGRDKLTKIAKWYLPIVLADSMMYKQSFEQYRQDKKQEDTLKTIYIQKKKEQEKKEKKVVQEKKQQVELEKKELSVYFEAPKTTATKLLAKPVIKPSARPQSGKDTQEPTKEELDKKNELVDRAFEHLQKIKGGADPEFDYGRFFLANEFVDNSDIPDEKKVKFAKAWEEHIEKYTKLYNGVKHLGYEAAVIEIMKELSEDYTGDYQENTALLLDVINGKLQNHRLGNCSARAKLLLATFEAINLELPEGFKYGLQVFDGGGRNGHVQLVIYDEKKKKAWDLISNSKNKNIIAPIIYPYAYLHSFVEKNGKTSPFTKEDLVMVQPTVPRIRIATNDPALNKPTNDNLSLPSYEYQVAPGPNPSRAKSPFNEKTTENKETEFSPGAINAPDSLAGVVVAKTHKNRASSDANGLMQGHPVKLSSIYLIEDSTVAPYDAADLTSDDFEEDAVSAECYAASSRMNIVNAAYPGKVQFFDKADKERFIDYAYAGLDAGPDTAVMDLQKAHVYQFIFIKAIEFKALLSQERYKILAGPKCNRFEEFEKMYSEISQNPKKLMQNSKNLPKLYDLIKIIDFNLDQLNQSFFQSRKNVDPEVEKKFKEQLTKFKSMYDEVLYHLLHPDNVKQINQRLKGIPLLENLSIIANIAARQSMFKQDDDENPKQEYYLPCYKGKFEQNCIEIQDENYSHYDRLTGLAFSFLLEPATKPKSDLMKEARTDFDIEIGLLNQEKPGQGNTVIKPMKSSEGTEEELNEGNSRYIPVQIDTTLGSQEAIPVQEIKVDVKKVKKISAQDKKTKYYEDSDLQIYSYAYMLNDNFKKLSFEEKRLILSRIGKSTSAIFEKFYRDAKLDDYLYFTFLTEMYNFIQDFSQSGETRPFLTKEFKEMLKSTLRKCKNPMVHFRKKACFILVETQGEKKEGEDQEQDIEEGGSGEEKIVPIQELIPIDDFINQIDKFPTHKQ